MKRPGRIAWFVLARELGMSVRQAQSEISSKEFSEWLAFWRISHDPDDRRAAMICSMIARSAGSKTAKPEDFMPRIKRKMQTPDEMKAQLAIAFGVAPPKAKR